MSSVRSAFKGKLKGAQATAGSTQNYVGDNPHEAQSSKSPPTSTGTNTGATTQKTKKKTTGSTGSGVNIV